MDRRQFLATSLAIPSAFAAPSSKPNLLFIMTDQHRSSALSCAGNSVITTPNLDRLAAQGAMYRNAITPCPVCVPARTSILTGRSMAGTTVTGNDAATDTVLDIGPSFDNLLAAQGYRTEYYGKYHAPYKMAKSYLNPVPYAGKKVEGAPSHHLQYLEYLDKHVPSRPLNPGEFLSKDYQRPYTPARLDPKSKDPNAESGQGEVFGWLHIPKEHSFAAYTVDEAIDSIQRLKDGPFSITCSVGPPHPPFLNVSPYWGMYPDRDIPLPKNWRHDMSDSPYRERAARMAEYQDADNVRCGLSIYYGMVKEVDDNIGRLLSRLDQLGLTNNTLVVFTSDHGEMMGSHGMGSKMVFYEESVHVPLLMRFPGRIKPGTVVDSPVSTMDLFATTLDYLGVAAPQREGYNLRADSPDFRVSEWAGNNIPNFMVRTRDWKLIMAKDPASRARDALFNLREDPGEIRNVLRSSPKQADEMKDRLLAFLERANSPHRNSVRERKFARVA
jgi:arylsulfatase A-like enzyme